MTPIAREFSPEERTKAQQELLSAACLLDAIPGLPHWHRDTVITLQCTVNHLTAQVEEARRLLEMTDGGGMKIGPEDWYPRRGKWLSANPVRTEEQV